MRQNVAPSKRPTGVTVIAFVNVLGWLTTEGVWVFLHLSHQIPSVGAVHSYWEKSYVGLVNGFTAADAVWSNLFLLASIVGLLKMKPWGWAAALMANTIWLYTMTFTLVRDLNVDLTFGMAFFIPFAVFAAVSTIYLWARRGLFWGQASL